MAPPKATPMVKQYLSIKEQYTDSILFFRMGDFYEMFFEDAEIASRVLEITLTSRNKNDSVPIPMCGIPARAVDSYIGRMIDKGFKVAICDQIEDPSKAKGLVKRDVVRIVTPGMIVDNELLDEKSNNYILAIAVNKGVIGLSYLDISTGAFRISESENINLVVDESLRVAPSEIIFPESSKKDPYFAPFLSAFPEKIRTYLDDRIFGYNNGREILIEQFRTRSLEGFGCNNMKGGVSAAGALLHYVRETQKQEISHLTGIETYSLDNYLLIDEISCRNLELLKNLQDGSKQGTLLGILDKTITAMGGRLLRGWIRNPLIDTEIIQSRLNAVHEVKDNIIIRRNIREYLKSVYDLERIGSKITMGRANARDLVAFKHSLNIIPDILSELNQLKSGLFKIENQPEDFQRLSALAALIEKGIREDAPLTINEGGIIKTGYSEELDELIRISSDGKSWLARLENEERDKTGISTLKVKYNKVFGYYIEVSKNRAGDVPDHYVRKQTLVNAERYITDELKTFETKVLGAQEQRASLEYEIFNKIRSEIIKENKLIMNTAQFIAGIDCLFNLAEVADNNGYSKPEINLEGIILIEEGRHPVVEKLITGERYVPNTIRLDNEANQVLIITGPNMAGKSTVLRQAALIVLMTQIGSFVPADRALIPVVDKIFTRVGALDNLSSGQSTFMVEMEETANILNNATPDSLVIIDEIGRGTSTFDGLSIAWSVAEYLHDLKSEGVKTLFATHYHELTELENSKTRVKNFNIAVKEWNDEIIFLRKLVAGGTNRSYGIQVARLAGLPETIIKRSKKVLSKIENGEQNIGNMSTGETDKTSFKNGQEQLLLFRKPDEIIIDKLKKLDLTKMTPIDALNYLNDLKEKAKSFSG
ncbi:MAG: DNA mismatch repair protein MutS [Desulfobacterales bacterium]|nr:DNA mismatch repair protein MutS [Desulfobacterales bacterium]